LLEPDAAERAIMGRHDHECSPARLGELVAGLRQSEAQAEQEVSQMLRQDRALRRELLAAGQATEATLPLWLGRPLEAVLVSLGWTGALPGMEA
jgi:hypothetical protein